MNPHIFSYQGIYELCSKYFQEIKERKPLKHILKNRKVRFILPNGSWKYAFFGDFYFNSSNVMMWICSDPYDASFHQPDMLSDTLWTTIPVIFAGVETLWQDDCGQEIYTGDIVTVDGYTSLVRYLFADSPGIVGDNVEVLFDRFPHQQKDGIISCKMLHKEGTAFCNLSKELFQKVELSFYPHYVYWATDGFCQGGDFEEIKKKAVMYPTFIDGKPVQRKRKPIFYMGDLDKYIKTDTDIITFLGARGEDEEVIHFYEVQHEDLVDVDDDNDLMYDAVYADNFPSKHEGEKTCCINIDTYDCDECEALKQVMPEFFLYAHSHPELDFYLCDFVKSLYIPQKFLKKVASIFLPVYQYALQNIFLPYWMMNEWDDWELQRKI